MKKYCIMLLPLIFMVCILSMSSLTSKQSANLSIGLSEKIVAFMEQTGPKYFTVNEVNNILRKLTHFSEYLLFTVLLFKSLEITTKKPWLSACLSITMCILLACGDESYQLAANRGRSFSVFDIMIDSAGGAIGLVTIAINKIKL